jgi:hypothetical protein
MVASRLIPTLIVLTGAAASLAAVDGTVNNADLRIEAMLLPEPYDFDITADSSLGSVSTDGSDDFDQPFRVGLAGVNHQRGVDNGPVGLVTGGAVYYSRLPGGNNDDAVVQALSLQVRVGLGIYLGDIFHVEATPFAGIGGARGDNGSSTSDIGLYWEYGVSAGAFASLGESLQLGVIGGWLHGRYDLDFDDDSNDFPAPVDNVNAKLTEEGFFIGASIGVRM